MKISKFLLSAFILSALFVSCNNDDDIQEPRGDYENGILISGEGGGVSGSVYYVSDDFSTVESQIYKKVNNSELSFYLQSMVFDNENAYICVDNQSTITVVDRYTFEKVGTITTGLETPRYMAVVGDKGYATNWGDGNVKTDDFVAVIDLNTFEVTSTIAVGNGPERIIERNGKLYVSHHGALTTNNIISVIDIASKAVTVITVNDNPDELFFDTTGNLVVLCEGKAAWTGSESSASITKINPTTNTVISKIVFPLGIHPLFLESDGNDLYYNVVGEIYKLSQTATSLPTDYFLNSEANLLYGGGMAVKDGNLFILDPNFTEESTLIVFNLATKAKTFTSKAPIAASKIYFN